MLKEIRPAVTASTPGRDSAAEHTPTAGDFAVEPLEARNLLSASVTAGVLSVTGGAGVDDIRVSAGASSGQVIVTGDPADDDGTQTFHGVSGILIEGLAGND